MPGVDKDIVTLFLEALLTNATDLPNDQITFGELLDSSLYFHNRHSVEFYLSHVDYTEFNVIANAFSDYFELDLNVLINVEIKAFNQIIVIFFTPEAATFLKRNRVDLFCPD